MSTAAESAAGPRILVFSTNGISDPGIDLAGSAHMTYAPTISVVGVPCSSGVDPRWITRAIRAGFDGVFVAADGTDCALVPDCTARTARVVQQAQDLLVAEGGDPRRVKMAAVCSVCAESFVNHVRQFGDALGAL